MEEDGVVKYACARYIEVIAFLCTIYLAFRPVPANLTASKELLHCASCIFGGNANVGLLRFLAYRWPAQYHVGNPYIVCGKISRQLCQYGLRSLHGR